MSKLDRLLDYYGEESLLIADGFDEAIIGVEENSMRVIYSVSKCIDILGEDMPIDEALEYFYYNVSGSYMGKNTPIWCEDLIF